MEIFRIRFRSSRTGEQLFWSSEFAAAARDGRRILGSLSKQDREPNLPFRYDAQDWRVRIERMQVPAGVATADLCRLLNKKRRDVPITFRGKFVYGNRPEVLREWQTYEIPGWVGTEQEPGDRTDTEVLAASEEELAWHRWNPR